MTKRTYLIIFLLLVMVIFCHAQEKGIRFQSIQWEQALRLAQESKKKIFVDCHTSWCGPCKMLARTTFLNDTVAAFFNENFINIKMDMEKGNGPRLAQQYKVNAYPTLLFLASDGQLIHSTVGFKNAEKLLAEAHTAIEGNETLSAYLQRYEQGERDADFMRSFLQRLYQGGRSDLQPKVATEFIDTFSEKEFYTRDCWNLITYHISDPMSPILQKMVANRHKFEQIIAKDTVDLFLNYAFNSKANRYLWMEPHSKNFDEQEFNAYVVYLKSISYPRTPIYLATMYTARKRQAGDYQGMIREMKKAFDYCIFQQDDKVQFVHACMAQIGKSGQTPLIEECIRWMRQLAASERPGYYKSEYMRAEARLLQVLGKDKEAETLDKEARQVRMQ